LTTEALICRINKDYFNNSKSRKFSKSMLAIRMQRTGRKGHAQFRLIVQESRRTPSSGNVVAALGNYDPHTKATTLDKEKAGFYLKNGAQPSPRVAALLQKEGVTLPSWVKVDTSRQAAIKNQDKLRRNRPEEPKAEAAPAEVEETVKAEEPAEAPAEVETKEAPVAEAEPADAPAAESTEA
jgi:small subunit ribosomal protein S16